MDGPEAINNASRHPIDGGNCFLSVNYNINQLKKKNIPFAIVAVLDRRIIDFNLSLSDLAVFLSSYTPVYKIDPGYMLIQSADTIKKLLKETELFVDFVFENIKTLEQSKFIYENNVLRTITNAINNIEKTHVCSAADHIAIFSNNSAYSCYNLLTAEYKICDDLSVIDMNALDEKLKEHKEKLLINKFPKEYYKIKFFGDYCPKENNFSSFAYQYRKVMTESILKNLNNISPGSIEHMGLLGYIKTAFSKKFFKTFI